MTSRRKLWLGSVVLYALFFSWYTDFGGPLTETEIQAYIAKTANLNLGGDPLSRGALLEFMRNDTGGQFLMFNAVDLAKNPPQMEGAPPDADGQTLIDLYMEHMIPALLSRASHPVAVGKSVADSLDLLGIEGAQSWSHGAIMRYRSRRDLLMLASEEDFNDIHIYKRAAIASTFAIPAQSIGGALLSPRIWIALFIFLMAALAHILYLTRRKGND